MHPYLMYEATRAEHRARIERVERFSHLYRDAPRRRQARLRVALRTWLSRRPVVSPAPAGSVSPVPAADGLAVVSPDGGHPVSDVSLAPCARQKVA